MVLQGSCLRPTTQKSWSSFASCLRTAENVTLAPVQAVGNRYLTDLWPTCRCKGTSDVACGGISASGLEAWVAGCRAAALATLRHLNLKSAKPTPRNRAGTRTSSPYLRLVLEDYLDRLEEKLGSVSQLMEAADTVTQASKAIPHHPQLQ